MFRIVSRISLQNKKVLETYEICFFSYHVRTQNGWWTQIVVCLLFFLTFNKEPNLIYIQKNDPLFGVYCCKNMQENETNWMKFLQLN